MFIIRLFPKGFIKVTYFWKILEILPMKVNCFFFILEEKLDYPHNSPNQTHDQLSLLRIRPVYDGVSMLTAMNLMAIFDSRMIPCCSFRFMINDEHSTVIITPN